MSKTRLPRPCQHTPQGHPHLLHRRLLARESRAVRSRCDLRLTGSTRIYSRAKALGTSTNNAAELEGLLMALSHAISWCRGHKRLGSSKPPPPEHIFCDNRYALGVADGKWKAKAHRPLVTHIQSTVASLRVLTAVLLLWVPGHADVEGNEVADRLAKGAALSTHPGLTPSPPLPLHPPLLAPPTHPI